MRRGTRSKIDPRDRRCSLIGRTLMDSKAKPRRKEASRRREKIETEEFLAAMQEQRRNWATYLAVFLGVVFAAIALLQSLGYANLSEKTFYAIVVSLLAIITYVVRAAFR
jgi:hypothetical protein